LHALEIIQENLKTGFISKRSDKSQSYRYISNSLIGFPVIISYFEIFPLKTIKKEAFLK